MQIQILPHQKSILHLIPARNLLPSLLPCLQLVKLNYSIEDRRSVSTRKHISPQEKKPFKLPTLQFLQFPAQKIKTPIKYKVSQNRKQGGLGRASEDMGPLNNINILSFQDNKEDLVRSFHSLPNPPYNSICQESTLITDHQGAAYFNDFLFSIQDS